MTRAYGKRLTALLIAAGMLLFISAPLRANDAAETEAAPAERTEQAGKPIALNKFAKRKRSAKAARVQKPRVLAKGYRRKALEAAAIPMNESESEPAAISETVANANAQWPSPDTKVQPVTAPTQAQPATSDVIASDQLNDLDKNLSATPDGGDAASQIATKIAAQVAQNASQAAGVNVPTTATPAMSAMASADRPTEVAGRDNNAWGQSSLIGKIFIAFGGLLTVASAARMFMA